MDEFSVINVENKEVYIYVFDIYGGRENFKLFMYVVFICK